MTKAVFFDLYNTLVRYDPPREQMQVKVGAEFGIQLTPQAVRRVLLEADDYFYRENARLPVSKRSREEAMALYTRYQGLVLRGCGLEVPPETALKMLMRLRQSGMKLVLYDDVRPSLTGLRGRGLVLGMISNVDRDMASVFQELGLDSLLDFLFTSHQVGSDKPNPAIFRAALERAGVQAAEAIHVGDQYHSDVRGAQAVGISPVLLDRGGAQAPPAECPTINTLAQLVSMVEAMLPQGAR